MEWFIKSKRIYYCVCFLGASRFSTNRSLIFNEHIQRKINKWYEIIGVIKKLSYGPPLDVLLRIFSSLVRPIIDYGKIGMVK